MAKRQRAKAGTDSDRERPGPGARRLACGGEPLAVAPAFLIGGRGARLRGSTGIPPNIFARTGVRGARTAGIGAQTGVRGARTGGIGAPTGDGAPRAATEPNQKAADASQLSLP